MRQSDDRVDFILSGKIENESFAKLVLRKTDISLEDLLLLDRIASGNNLVGTDIEKIDAEHLKTLRYIEVR
jgi:hypothetical protein